MTPSLRELQRAFAAAVYEGAPGILAHVRDGIFPAARHVQVYRRNTFANLTDALAASYPVVQRLVGEGFFEYAADGYIRAHPPRSGNLHDFGAAFAQFLAEFAPAQSLRYLPDVARLEWARQEAYHAADAPAFDFTALAAVPAERHATLLLRLHPSVRLLESEYPILQIWRTNQPDVAGDVTVHLDQGGACVLVVRRDLEVINELLSAGEYALLHAVSMSLPLAEANDAALAAEPDLNLALALRRHVQSGTISGFVLE